jgi:hypothetical protein
MCTWENLFSGISIGWTEECTVVVVLLLVQLWQSLHSSAICEPIFLHTNLADISRLLALMPGWAMLWMEEKTCCLKLTGTTGLAVICDTSQAKSFPVVGKKFNLRRGFANDFLSVSTGPAAKSPL